MSKLCKYECGRTAERGKSRCRTCRRSDKRTTTVVRPGGPRVLLIDIETSPMLVYTWGLWDQNIGLNQIVEPTRMLCFAAKWLGESKVHFFSEKQDGHRDMVMQAWAMLDNADVVVHYYGSRFDVPHLNREFLGYDLPPPSPYRQVDLKLAVSKRFKFPSNKLQFVSQALGFEGKVQHEGFDLWRKCMGGDERAWQRMEKYNVQDVKLLEDVYEALLPWIPNVPHRHLYDAGGCPNCGADSIRQSGLHRTALSVYQRHVCTACGSWFRGNRRVGGVKLQGVAW